MKRILLLTAAALLVTSAQAQLLRPQSIHAPAKPYTQAIKPKAKKEVAQMRTPGTIVEKAPNKARNVSVWCRRPAGAFPCIDIVEDEAFAGIFFEPYLSVTPYTDYTFTPVVEGYSDNADSYWSVSDPYDSDFTWLDPKRPLTMMWEVGIFDMPVFWVCDEGETYYWIFGYKMDDNPQMPEVVDDYKSYIFSIPSSMDFWGVDVLKSSKSLCWNGPNSAHNSLFTYYGGAEPYGNNEKGWWFGKNGGDGRGYRIDGIAQAFEKPTTPYLLKQVVVDCAVLDVAAPVDMTCKIYKLNDIPAYNDTGAVLLPDEPGELIAQGRAALTPETKIATGGLIFFTLYDDDDGLEYDVAPTIDCAILVVIDGYNEPEMENLTDFSAMVFANDQDDEGFGELAYLKVGIPDDGGNVDHYVWHGLNNFFKSGQMMTGLSIFLSTENPYLKLSNDSEQAEYLFPNDGGDHSIEFWSWEPSADDAWSVTCDGEKVPDWLNIEFTDSIEDGEFSGVVIAEVTAKPLPFVVKYREAIVRFGIPGDYIEYKFKQGEKTWPIVPSNGDVNGDGSVNIADVNLVIEMILADTHFDSGDLDVDFSVTIADLQRVIAIILGWDTHPIW